jgi:protease I
MKRILIFIGPKFEDSEFIYPYYRFQEADFKVDVVGFRGESIFTGKHGTKAETTVTPKQVKTDNYEAFIIVGGYAPDKMRQDNDLVELVKNGFEEGKIIAAICHGPQLLIEADILEGKKATAYRAIVTDIKNAGAKYEDQPVVTDGNLVTARDAQDLPDFCKEILRLLKR